jgi:hypothetical protein
MARIRTEQDYRSILPEVRAAARAALVLLDREDAFRASYQGPIPTDEMRALIEVIGPDVPVRVRCSVRGHVYVTWVLDTLRIAVVPRTRRGRWTSEALDTHSAWTERANAGKGPVSYRPIPGQGYHGTHEYSCGCGSNRNRMGAVSSKRRTQLYLEAVAVGRDSTWI